VSGDRKFDIDTEVLLTSPVFNLQSKHSFELSDVEGDRIRASHARPHSAQPTALESTGAGLLHHFVRRDF
jgi:hypothetical protein